MPTFPCPDCRNLLKVGEESAGKRVRCPRCQQVVQVPAVAASPSLSVSTRTESPTLPPRPKATDPPPSKHATAVSPGEGDTLSPAPGQAEELAVGQEFAGLLAPSQGPGELGRLGRYRVLKVLGKGGMGVVFQAEDTLLKRPVALKAMLPALAASSSNRERFLREAPRSSKTTEPVGQPSGKTKLVKEDPPKKPDPVVPPTPQPEVAPKGQPMPGGGLRKRFGLVTPIDHTPRHASVAFTSDGKTLACGCLDKTIGLWDVATGQQKAILKGHTSAVTSVALSGDGKTLASWAIKVGEIKLWDVATGQEKACFQEDAGYGVRFMANSSGVPIAFRGDCKTLAVISPLLYAQVNLWESTTGQKKVVTLKRPAGSVTAVAFSGDGKTLALGDVDKTVKLLDVATGQEKIILKGHDTEVMSITFSGNSRMLASGSTHTIKLWDLPAGQQIDTFQRDFYRPYSMAFSGDGKTLALGCSDLTIRLWDVATGQEKAKHLDTRPVIFVAFSEDGKMLASAGNAGNITLWDVAGGQ